MTIIRTGTVLIAGDASGIGRLMDHKCLQRGVANELKAPGHKAATHQIHPL